MIIEHRTKIIKASLENFKEKIFIFFRNKVRDSQNLVNHNVMRMTGLKSWKFFFVLPQ